MRLLRGLAHRRASTALLALLAVGAAAAAATLPCYQPAARSSILRQILATPGTGGNQLEVSTMLPGEVALGPAPLAGQVAEMLDASLGSATARLFAPPVLADELDVNTIDQTFPLVSRTGVCAALRLLAGHCPDAPGQVIASAADAADVGTRVGRRLPVTATKELHVVGVYAQPNPAAPVWFDRGQLYFPAQGVDALFTTPVTIGELPSPGATVVDDLAIRPDAVTPGNLAGLQRAVNDLLYSSALADEQVSVTSQLPAAAGQARQGWSSLSVPAVLVSAELIVLVWMLLFLVITEDVDSRGGEVALARLRGLPRRRVLAVAVSEPLMVLAVAVPIGVVLGRLVARLLAHRVLAPGVPVGTPALAWAAAAVAVLGGAAAVTLAAHGVLARSVLDQWRRTPRHAAARGWVVDAVLLTATAAGLVDLLTTGVLRSASHSLLVELVPGLIGLAVAVVASRLLPLACAAVARVRGARSQLAGFLAVRHIARRPGGARTTVVLATAVALATFGTAASSVGRADRHLVADVQVGAATVLTVSVPPGRDLASIVDAVDPSGRRAVAVDDYYSSGSPEVLAVQPARFAAVAAWAPRSTSVPLGTVAARLAPPVAAPVTIDGSALRLTYAARGATAGQLSVVPYVDVAGTGAVPVAVGAPHRTGGSTRSPTVTETVSGPLSGCPCQLGNIELNGPAGVALTASATLTGLAVRTAGGWHALSGLFTRPGQWASQEDQTSIESVAATPGGLRWRFDLAGFQTAQINVADFPAALPAVGADAAVPPGAPLIQGIGLNGASAFFHPVARASAVPGAPADGLVVDQVYAQRAAGDVNLGQQQVWLRAGSAAALEPALRAHGVHIDAVATSAAAQSGLDREGPALASGLLLLDSAAAAVLAAVAAATALTVAARRRRYEYASLIASGAGRWVVWRSLVLEQGLVLGFAAVVGVLAGLLGVVLAVRKVPVLSSVPAAPALSYTPSTGVLAVALVAALALLTVAAVASSSALVRSVGPASLREQAQ